MKKKYSLMLLLAMFMAANNAFSQSPESDSVDVRRYSLNLDLGHSQPKHLDAQALIHLKITRPCSSVDFDLICDSVTAVVMGESATPVAYTYDRSNAKLTVQLLGNIAVGEDFEIDVAYVSSGYVEGYGWGGLHFDNDIYYNLGVAFDDYPHNYGRAWFPCRDNFYDKASYDITVTTKPGWRTICSGLKLTEVYNADNSVTSTWILEQETPTYLVSVAAANWHVIERDYQGVYDEYPAIIAFTTHDSTHVYEAYDILEDVIPMYERCFGPYRWDRVGYVATPKGSMEHVQNIGLVSVCMADKGQVACQMTICHELAHAWFGNTVTCASQEDMWFNEGGASFCEEIANEAAFGKSSSIDYYQDMLSQVLRMAHIDDGGYRSLSGMDQYHTYGTTTYKQGAMMWHSLRGYMGDSLFYSSLQHLFATDFPSLTALQVRDSLMAYSGMDLTDFFNFHVFNPGFVDYAIDSFSAYGNTATITIRQLLKGAPDYCRGNRVPVTFFSQDRQQADRLMVFDDSVFTQTFELPFNPAYAVVDYYHMLSDASTDDTAQLRSKGLRDLTHSLCRLYVGQANSDPTAWVHVGHHYARPQGQLPEGILRISNRYWQVAGLVPWDGDVQGRFLYNLGSTGSAGAPFLDYGFYDNRNTLDSLSLVYRATPAEPWRVVSRTRTSSSSISTGYFTARLFPGQYALAVVDTNLASIPAISSDAETTFRLFPNPSAGQEFTIDLGSYDKNFNLIIVDQMGRKVLQKNNLTSGTRVAHNLPSGTYFAIIQNNFLSLHSQIIIQ